MSPRTSLLCRNIFLVLRDHWLFVYIWKWSAAHALGGVMQWCGIFHYHWWTVSIKPRLLFSHSGLVVWGLPFLQFIIREQRLLKAIKSEIELNRLRAENHTDKYKQLDNDMHRIISNKSNGASKSLLLSWWNETCE